jgi:hypothetical protein
MDGMNASSFLSLRFGNAAVILAIAILRKTKMVQKKNCIKIKFC